MRISSELKCNFLSGISEKVKTGKILTSEDKQNVKDIAEVDDDFDNSDVALINSGTIKPEPIIPTLIILFSLIFNISAL